MKIELKLFATLARYTPTQIKDSEALFEVPEGYSVADLIQRLEIPDQTVKLVFINGRHAGPQARLQAGDRVGLFPPVGGG